MATIDTQYFFVVSPRQDFLDRDIFPSLTPDEDTAELPYSYEKLPLGSKPLKFTNGKRDRAQRRGHTIIRRAPDVLFSGSNPLVKGDLREKLLALDIPHLELQPAIFVDDWDKWHEDYWFLTFTQRFDCWSRKTSDYEKGSGPIRIGGSALHQIYKFRLDEKVMEKTPLQERLLFQMGGSQDAFVVAHNSIAHLFAGTRNGAQVISVEDFPDGY